MHQNRGYHRLRKARRSLTNHYYLITTQTYQREPIFLDGEPPQVVLKSLKWLDQHEIFALDTAVIMPDHIHLLFQLKDRPLQKIMQQFKSFTSKQIDRLMGKKGHVWQSGYHDHAVRKEEDLNQIRLYCVHNPVRANIVHDFHDYPYWYCCLEI